MTGYHTRSCIKHDSRTIDEWTVEDQEHRPMEDYEEHIQPKGYEIESQRISDLEHIAKAIEKSRMILELKNNWDREGSKGYSYDTWERATSFLYRNARLWNSLGVTIDAPTILPGQDGSIDIYWKTKKYELLINIPAKPDKEADYYGDNYGKLVAKGTFYPSSDTYFFMDFFGNVTRTELA